MIVVVLKHLEALFSVGRELDVESMTFVIDLDLYATSAERVQLPTLRWNDNARREWQRRESTFVSTQSSGIRVSNSVDVIRTENENENKCHEEREGPSMFVHRIHQ